MNEPAAHSPDVRLSKGGSGLYETSYTVDRAMRRGVVLDWALADPWTPAFAAVLVLAALGLVFSASARILFAIFLGVSLTYFGWRLFAFRTPHGFADREVTLRFDDDALTYTSAVRDSRASWSSVSSVLVGRKAVFMSLDGALFAVPRSALTAGALAFLLNKARQAGARIRGSQPATEAEIAQ